MLYEAAHLADEQVSPAVMRENPKLARCVEGWGRAHDVGFLAVDANRQPVGAAWMRLLAGDTKGYGYVDAQTPELSVAVLPGPRGRGLGSELLARLLEAARACYPAVSLSATNPALRLYRTAPRLRRCRRRGHEPDRRHLADDEAGLPLRPRCAARVGN